MPDDPLADRTLTRWETAVLTGECPYTVGPTWAMEDTATFEFKSSATGYTGGGYARWRSIEYGPEVSRVGKGEVFVSVHRLAALVWCFDGDVHVGADADYLRDRDVHHMLEIPSANLPDHIEVLDHAEHSRQTQADRTRQRAWFEDAKREAEQRQRGEYVPDEQACAECGAEVEAAVLGTEYCLECATTVAKGRDVTVEIL